MTEFGKIANRTMTKLVNRLLVSFRIDPKEKELVQIFISKIKELSTNVSRYELDFRAGAIEQDVTRKMDMMLTGKSGDFGVGNKDPQDLQTLLNFYHGKLPKIEDSTKIFKLQSLHPHYNSQGKLDYSCINGVFSVLNHANTL